MSSAKSVHMEKLRVGNIKGKGQTDHGFYNSGGQYRTRDCSGKTKACQLWENLRVRTQYWPKYDESRMGKYAEVCVTEEWKDFQKFAEWFDKISQSGYYNEGWQLDKDLLIKGNKIYSPETCVFLPEDINKALNIRNRNRGKLPLGICRDKRRNKIDVRYDCKNPDFGFRKYMDISEVEAGFLLYKNARESYVKSLAHEYKNNLEPRAFTALLAYEVNIDD